MMVNKKIVIGAVIVVVLIGIFSFMKSSSPQSNTTLDVAGSWINIELKDVKTGEFFTITDFDKPVLLESFAVWCPTCTRQQRETKKFHEEVGDSVISISIDTDPNEDENQVRQHIESNGFDWFYAIAPIQFTQSLIDQFGVSIVNAPSVPMVLICDSQNVKKLGSGIKSPNELKEAINKFC